MAIFSGDIKIGQAFADPLQSATPEDLAEIDTGQGRVPHPAELASIKELETLRSANQQQWPALNNFFMFFAKGGEDNPLSDLKRQSPCYQRFAIIYPVLNQRLLDSIGSLGSSAMVDSQYLLEEAYELMAKLVDANDPHVTNDSKIDRLYLIR